MPFSYLIEKALNIIYNEYTPETNMEPNKSGSL